MQIFILQADKSLITKVKNLFEAIKDDEAFMQELTDEQLIAFENIQLAKI